jgi:hypothetical protein
VGRRAQLARIFRRELLVDRQMSGEDVSIYEAELTEV